MKQLFQSHWTLYQRYSAMASVLANQDKLTDEQKVALASLNEHAAEHYRKARIFNHDRFLMVV